MGKSSQITKAQTIRKREMSKIVFGVRRRFRFLLVVFKLKLKLWTKSGAISSLYQIIGACPQLFAEDGETILGNGFVRQDRN